jgi:hypothetical protein
VAVKKRRDAGRAISNGGDPAPNLYASQSLLLLLMAGCSTRAHSCVIDQRGSPYIARYYGTTAAAIIGPHFSPLLIPTLNAFSAFVLINPGMVLCTREEKNKKVFIFPFSSFRVTLNDCSSTCK